MPFTPFHMGAALLVKPVARAWFRVLTFGIAQIAMDIEPGIGMLLGWEVLHGPSHTVLGALVIACLVAWIAPWVCTPILRRYNREVIHHKQAWLSEPDQLDKVAMWSGALFGTLSHIFLDSLMHHDMHPLAPFSKANPLMDLVSHDGVYHWCVVMGVVGSAWWLRMKWKSRPGALTTQPGVIPAKAKSNVVSVALALAVMAASTDAFVLGIPFFSVFLAMPYLLVSPILIVMAVFRRGRQELKAVCIVVLMAFATVFYCSWLDDIAEKRSQPVIDAIDRYRIENGVYPQSLDDVVPRYLSALPELKPVGGSPALKYELVQGHAELSFKTGFAFDMRMYEFANRA